MAFFFSEVQDRLYLAIHHDKILRGQPPILLPNLTPNILNALRFVPTALVKGFAFLKVEDKSTPPLPQQYHVQINNLASKDEHHRKPKKHEDGV